MSTTIKYTNLSGVQMTAQQAQNIQDYHNKEYYENTELRMSEFFDRSGELLGRTYYLRENEDLANAVVDFADQHVNIGFYFNKQLINGYTIWDIESYVNTTKTYKAKEVLNSTGKTISYQTIDINSNEIIDTRKYFYLEDLGSFFSSAPPIPDNGRFDFHYNFSGIEPGGVFVAINLMLYMDVGGGGFYIDTDENIFLEDAELAAVFNWADHPYYHNALPLIPNTLPRWRTRAACE